MKQEKNAFEIFELKPTFKIENLDNLYFEKYKAALQNNQEEIELINNSYKLLKNEIERAKLLCKLNNETEPDHYLAKQMFDVMSKPDEEKELMLVNTKNEIIKHAKDENWKETWHNLQKYSYIYRLLNPQYELCTTI